MNIEDYGLDWATDRPEGTDEAVRADIARELGGSISDPSRLFYHTVFLGDDMEEGPGVIVEGGDDSFRCFYYARIGDAFVTGFPNMEDEAAG